MSEIAAAGVRPAWRSRIGAGAGAARGAPDARRLLQLTLAGIWLLDGLLQYQAFMFSKGFTDMISGTASGNPRVVASPVTWNASLVQHHLVLLNTIFATIQVLIGVGIAWRPTVRVALAASIAWSLGVWWFGEGLGMVLTGEASPVNGAPGAVILYALLAVLLWPSDRPAPATAPFTAARAVGAPVARALWLVLWLSLAYFALLPANRAPQALHDMIAGMTDGEPGWLAALDRGAASLVAHQGLAASIVLAIALVIVAVGVYLPTPAARGTLVLAIVVAAVFWVFGQALGVIMTGGGTDPNSGPLLALLALAYWPARAVVTQHRAGPGGRQSRRDSRIMIPSWILDIFAAVMLVVAAVSAARLVAARPWQRGTQSAALTDIDVAHLLMGIAMAGQLVAGLQTLPNGAWEVIFAVMTAWFAYRVVLDVQVSGVRALAGGHCAPHLIHAGAMLYMFAAVSAPAAHGSGGMAGMGGGMSGMGTLELPILAFLFALALVGYSIWDLDQLSGPGASGHYSLAAARVAPTAPVLAGVGASARPAAGRGAAPAPEPAPMAAEAPQVVPPASAPADGTGVLAPWVATSCRIAMGVTMAFMLLIMI